MLLLFIPAMLPLAAPGYFFNAHDARHSVFWLVEFDRAVQDGALWPIWAPDIVLGFGYPLWLVYAPLAYIVAEGFHLLGLGFTVAVKATWAFSFLLGGLGMYALARRWWGRAAALVAALAYTYAPYHLAQIYVRGALAEFVALAIFPWTLLGFAALWDNPRARGVAWAALALAALLLTHSGAAILFLPVLCGFLAVKALTSPWPFSRGADRAGWWRKVGWSLLALALGGALAAVFLVPLFLERRYIGAEVWLRNTYDYRLHFVYPSQFFDPTWGYGYSVPGPNDGMSFQLGLVPILCAAIGLLGAFSAVLAIRQSRRGQTSGSGSLSANQVFPALAEVFFFAMVAGVAAFAMTPAAKPLWGMLPLVSMIQFPWRLLALTVIMLALLSGAGVWWLECRFKSETRLPKPLHVELGGRVTGRGQGSLRSPYVYVIALVVVLGSFAYTRPQLVPIRPQDESPLAAIDFEMQHPDMRGTTFWAERQPADADSPLLPQYLAGQPLTKAAIVAGQGTILEQSHTANSAFARVLAAEPVRLRFYTSYFPGWRATVDGQPVEIQPDPPNGLIGLDLDAGEHLVQLQFGATPVRKASAALSVVGLVLLVGLWLANGRRGDLRK
jgi:hypothetical protein